MLNVYVGYDGQSEHAYSVTKDSILDHTEDVNVISLHEPTLRRKGIYTRTFATTVTGQKLDLVDGKPFSTSFSFTRFLVPYLEDYGKVPAIFVDGDFLFLDDIRKIANAALGKSVACVMHNYAPLDSKMYNYANENYSKKNWSSLMVFNPQNCIQLTPSKVSSEAGAWLHQMKWVENGIAGLDRKWNVLYDTPNCGGKEVSAVHFTNGTPDMVEYSDKCQYVNRWWQYVR